MLTLEHKRPTSRGRALARPAPQFDRLAHSARPAIQRVPACACGGSCPRCQAESTLKIGAPGDAYEREADAVADRVMRMPAESAEAQVARRARGTVVNRVSTSLAAPASTDAGLASVVAHGTSSGGNTLDENSRAFMESRFGRDFSDVRVHTGTGAAESAQAIGAVAYTVGSDIVFGAGYYAPHTAHGRRLLAHELTHTVQQDGAPSPQVARVADPAIHTGAQGLVQMVGECAGKGYRNCSGSCVPADGRGTGFCAWSGSIATGCICYRRDQPMLREVQQFLFNLMIAALIAAGIVLTVAAIGAIVACLMGPCEVAALIGAIGYAAAMIVLGILGTSRGGGAAGGDQTAAVEDFAAPGEDAAV